jgi:hypothetical protein
MNFEELLDNNDRIKKKGRKPRGTRTNEERLAYLKQWRLENARMHKSTRLKSLYGVTLDEYEEMYLNQEGKCAICGEHKELGGKKGLVIDHCHQTGKVRELLCGICNSLLGRMEANMDVLHKFFEYRKKHGRAEDRVITIF